MNLKSTKDMETALPSSCAILGATGSVGQQALAVAKAEGVPVSLITARESVSAMETLVRQFSPKIAVMTEPSSARALALAVADTKTQVLSGEKGIEEALSLLRPEVVINAILGKAGLMPTLWALQTGCRLGLANKESIVIAGDHVKEAERAHGGKIIPVDSEHSAIFQALSCGRREEVQKILLTASGGPFFGYTREALSQVTKAQTLAHPTWRMGQKITVDSADLMNKGFEVIEAVHLFDVRPEQVEVVVHRESIIHSAVEYIDRAVIAQMSVPDMQLCVQYAMSYPARVPGPVAELDLFSVGKLTFAKPDTEAFPLLRLAYDSIQKGGGVPAVLNAANEIAVAAFLEEKLSFLGIAEVVEETVCRLSHAAGDHALSALLSWDEEGRRTAKTILDRRCAAL